MQSKGCKPDSVTYGGLILAYEKGGQWRRALAVFDQMKSNNCRPDSVVYNTVVGVLWNTGVVWAQAKAVQVHRHAFFGFKLFSAARLDWWYNRLVQMRIVGSCAFNSRPQTCHKALTTHRQQACYTMKLWTGPSSSCCAEQEGLTCQQDHLPNDRLSFEHSTAVATIC